jgi:hypothetical protein
VAVAEVAAAAVRGVTVDLQAQAATAALPAQLVVTAAPQVPLAVTVSLRVQPVVMDTVDLPVRLAVMDTVDLPARLAVTGTAQVTVILRRVREPSALLRRPKARGQLAPRP